MSVTRRVCPRKVLTGETDEAAASTCSAGKMCNVKSAPAVRSTREDGKNRSEDTYATWMFGITFWNFLVGAEVDSNITVPSSYPVAICDPSGDMSKAVIFVGYPAE